MLISFGEKQKMFANNGSAIQSNALYLQGLIDCRERK
jgi:hypothetical protein